jgi:hypothetical protein
MFVFPWARPRPLLTAYLIVAVSAAFLFAAVAPVRSLELEAPGPVPDACYSVPVTTADCLAVIPKPGQSTGEDKFSFRPGSPEFLISLDIFNGTTAFSKPRLAGKNQADSVNIKNSILLKLRI